MKMTNCTTQWDAKIAWYSPSANRRICRGHEGDEPYYTVRCQDRLILSECKSSNLPRSWRWRTILHSEMLKSPDTLRVQIAEFIGVVKVKNNTGLWDAWYSQSATCRIYRGHKDDKQHRTVRYIYRLILFETRFRNSRFYIYVTLFDRGDSCNPHEISSTIWLLYSN